VILRLRFPQQLQFQPDRSVKTLRSRSGVRSILLMCSGLKGQPVAVSAVAYGTQVTAKGQYGIALYMGNSAEVTFPGYLPEIINSE